MVFLLKIAIIGTGGIITTCLDALNEIPAITAAAIYARPQSKYKAEELAKKYNIEKIYTDFTELLADPAIDFVYIGIINSLHYQYSKEALLAGKNVICEKPLTSNIAELNELIDIAQLNNLFYFEAITLLHSPNYAFIRQHLAAIGRVRMIQANYFQYSSRYDKFLAGNILPVFDPKYSGGCLYDLNIYNLHFVIGLFGPPNKAVYYANTAHNGIDTSGAAVLTYPDCIAVCSAAKDSESISGVIIEGEKGYLHLAGAPNECRNISLHLTDMQQDFDGQQYNSRMTDEFIAFNKIFTMNNLSECHKLLEHSRTVMQVLTDLRLNAGIAFPADK